MVFEFNGAIRSAKALRPGDLCGWLLWEVEKGPRVSARKAHQHDLIALLTALLAPLLAVLERRNGEAVRIMQETDTTREPETVEYFARHYAKMRYVDSAINLLNNACALDSSVHPRRSNAMSGYLRCGVILVPGIDESGM